MGGDGRGATGRRRDDDEEEEEEDDADDDDVDEEDDATLSNDSIGLGFDRLEGVGASASSSSSSSRSNLRLRLEPLLLPPLLLLTFPVPSSPPLPSTN